MKLGLWFFGNVPFVTKTYDAVNKLCWNTN